MAIVKPRIDGRDVYLREGDGCKAVSLTDDTMGELFDYDARCPSCWLGHGHSGAYHRQSLMQRGSKAPA